VRIGYRRGTERKLSPLVGLGRSTASVADGRRGRLTGVDLHAPGLVYGTGRPRCRNTDPTTLNSTVELRRVWRCELAIGAATPTYAVV